MTTTAATDALAPIVVSPEEMARTVAAEIATLVRERREAGRTAVLGLATGRTMVPLYDELVRLHREEGLSFANVITFNLDEYLGLPTSHPASFRQTMAERLFDHVDLPPENAHLPDGELHESQIESRCAEYERSIAAARGIDLQLLGLGVNGHIGFNEPGSGADSRTRAVELAPSTRESASSRFGGLPNVPERAITMGIATILEARRIRLLALGEGKRDILADVVSSPVTTDVPATLLRGHPDVKVYADPAAAQGS